MICVGTFPKVISLEDVDICTIFYNGMQNALEECQKIPGTIEKNILIELLNNEDKFFITIKNPVVSDIKIEKGNLMTSKEDKERHDKYGGLILWNLQDEFMQLEISFYNIIEEEVHNENCSV